MNSIRRACAIAALCAASAAGQCAVCYRTAQSLSGARARALNAGILILGAPPILIVAGFVLLIRRRGER